MNQLSLEVAKPLYIAMLCSDKGKGIYELPEYDEESKRLRELGYKQKDIMIQLAIFKILKNGSDNCGASFQVYYKQKKDRRGPKFLVIFKVNINGKIKKLVFHAKGLEKFVINIEYHVRKSNSKKTAWDIYNTLLKKEQD